jgi:hypothetical protein
MLSLVGLRNIFFDKGKDPEFRIIDLITFL